MKNNLSLILILLLFFTCISAKADMGLYEVSDFTGDAFFSPAYKTPITAAPQEEQQRNGTTSKGAVPPLKVLRLKISEKIKEHNAKKNELAPTGEEDAYVGEIETSEYASKEVVDNFDNETVSPDGFEADGETVTDVQKPKHFWNKKKKKEVQEKNNEEIILDCDNVDYDTPNYMIYAKGNVNVLFVEQGTTLKSDIMTFDRANNTIKAEGNVTIIKGSQVITGDYIFVDLNEENALIENPMTKSANIEMHAKHGYVYGDKVVQKDGTIDVSGSMPIYFSSEPGGPNTLRMLTAPKDTLEDDIKKNIIKIETRDIKITQNGDLETIAFKKLKIRKNEKTVFKVPAIKFYTNKTHDYVESNFVEFGSYRDLGAYIGPNWVFELPKGSVLKVAPTLIYKSGFGIGAFGRFNSGTNRTIAGYGTAASKIIVYGKQKLDDHVYLQYGMNEYMDEWFLGRRRPKYGAELYYMDEYSSTGFLIKNQRSTFRHRLGLGIYKDLDHDLHYEKLAGNHISTPRLRYMADANQIFCSYTNKEKQTSFNIGVGAQLSATAYGTGDTQFIGRLGPNMHIQYKRWMQDVGFFLSAYEDNSPMPVFDAYRYGKQNLYVREYLRLCKYLTVCWFGSINVSNDSPNGQAFQENTFYLSMGPEDLKFNVGYDFIRENLFTGFEIMLDAKGTHVKYDTFEIKQNKKAKKDEEKKSDDGKKAPVSPRVLDRAVVENIKIMEDVL